MKESVTKFDLEAAFKALDEIDVPVSNEGVKANRPALTEIFSRKTKFDSLFEEYYDIGSTEELGQAKEDREAEVAKAKLERIEKIVDLDADSPEDLLTSYVGKYIIQCPQCMTLFYKNQEDVVESEEDSTTVNVSEVCQHCGNESGYTLVGKVGEATPKETELPADESPMADEELPDDEMPEETTEDAAEEASEGEEDLGDFDLDALNLDEEPAEEEKKEESFVAHTGETLVEDVKDDKELDAKLKAHNEYIEYLRAAIAEEESKLEKTDNEQVKAAIQRRIDAFKADLDAALPDEVKNNVEVSEEPAEDEPVDESTADEETVDTLGEALVEALKEEKGSAKLDVSADDFEQLINEPDFKKPISDSTVRAMLAAEKDTNEKTDEALTEGIFDAIKNGLSKAKDNFGKFLATKVKSRAGAADWILANACVDPDKVEIDDKGKIYVEDDNRKFQTFIVIGFTNKYKNGKPINIAPSPKKLAELTVGMTKPQAKDDYASADSLAKGWSMRNGCGPAFIYLANSADDENAVFLCEYFKGKLEFDQLNKHFESIKNDIKSAELVARSGGIEENFSKANLNTIMGTLDELQEESLEKFISDSLVESYGNVAGFRLTSGEYLDESFKVNGTVYFTSGATRKLTYAFSEAYSENGKVKLYGLNEKLGLDKRFTLTGKIDEVNKTFITESFIRNK